MDEKKEEQDGSNKEDMGKTTTTEQSEMAPPPEEDPLKKAFQSALHQNVADSELDTKEKAATDANAMTARDDQAQQPQQQESAENGASADKAPPSDNEDDTPQGGVVAPTTQQTQGASPVATPPAHPQPTKKGKTGVQEREMTAMDEQDKEQQPSSDTGVSSEETIVTKEQTTTPKRKSAKRKKTKKKKKKTHHETMAPPPFYQFPFFALLPQVQAQERRKRAKKKDKPSHSGVTREEQPVPSPTPKTAAPTPHEAPKKIEAVKIQQKEDDNGYLNLADLQAEEKKLYGEEKKIGAPGEEYICLADANEAAGPPAAKVLKDGASSGPSGSGKSSKPPEAAPKSPAAAKSPLTKEEFQDAVLTPRAGQGGKAQPVPPPKTPPPKDVKKHNLTSDTSQSRKQRTQKPGAPAAPRPGAPVNPRQLQHPQQPAPSGSVAPHKTKHPPVPAGSMTPNKGQPTKRKTPAMPVRPPPHPTDKKGAAPSKKNATKDEFQDAVLTPVNKNQPKGGGTRR